jgi:hypothetical protein
VKKRFHKSCKGRFHCKYPGFHVPALSINFELVKNVCSTGSLLDKKYTRQNTVLTKECLMKLEPSWKIHLKNPRHYYLNRHIFVTVFFSGSTRWHS